MDFQFLRGGGRTRTKEVVKAENVDDIEIL
jgi:hypothetical protein